MLTAEGCASRRERLWRHVPESVEWLLVADPRHVLYLSNFWVNPLSFSAGERGLLLLERSAGATLLADNFTRRSAAGQPFVDREVIEDWYDHKHSVINRDHALLAAVKLVAERISGRPGIAEAEALPLAAQEVLDPRDEHHAISEGAGSGAAGRSSAIDLGTLLRSLRRQKDADEIALLNIAMRATEAGLARAREVIRAGITDWDIYREMNAAILQTAGRPVQIYGDFRATTPDVPKAGGAPVGHVLAHGELFIMDYSVVVDGYRSDITNTLSVGSPPDKLSMLFEMCQAAMRGGESALRAGQAAKEVYNQVAEPFRAAGYGDAFPHHAGHGIGLAHPEPPILVPFSNDELLAGDVVTLEPGLYIKGLGGMRIEHNYLITADGFQRLSHHMIALT